MEKKGFIEQEEWTACVPRQATVDLLIKGFAGNIGLNFIGKMEKYVKYFVNGNQNENPSEAVRTSNNSKIG